MRLLTFPLLALLSLTLIAQSPPSNLELAGQVLALQKELATLKEKITALEQENAALRAKLSPTSQPAATTSRPATRPAATKPATLSQDGPGLYRVTAGHYRKFSADIRAKSRDDALTQGLKTVGKKAMDFDENSEIGPMTIEKIGD